MPLSLPSPALTWKGLVLTSSLILTLAVLVLAAHATEKHGTESGSLPINGHVETGQIQWLRDYDMAFVQSKKHNRPVMLLFQEVPGCQGCRDFGKEALSHPLIVEAAENLFVPLCIHNNKSGEDARVLKQYREPSWNYPVIRYVDGGGKDLIPRKDRIYSTQATAARMAASLKQADEEVPVYLQLLADEGKGGLETATFQMGCFWHGQARLGGIDGVVNARAGWAGGAEVVELTFDPAVVSYEKLVKAADSQRCAIRVYAANAAQKETAAAVVGTRAADATRVRDIGNTDAHQYCHLRRTALIHLPLTAAQATKANAAIEAGKSPLPYLSHQQAELFKRVKTLMAAGHAKAFHDHILPEDPSALALYQHNLLALVETLEAK
ncbi:MAG: VPGUxxT family thioredoxin-like (seleno)protein, type 2 [Planctomycetota bacterium]